MNMKNGRRIEEFRIPQPHQCHTTLGNYIGELLDGFYYRNVTGKKDRFETGCIKLYFSNNLSPYVKRCEYIMPDDRNNGTFIFGNHHFNKTLIETDPTMESNMMRVDFTWKEEDAVKPKSIKKPSMPVKPKQVIWHNPATIVYWEDGTKTVVKRQKGDRWDPEKGYAMAIVKKFMGLKTFYEALDNMTKIGGK